MRTLPATQSSVTAGGLPAGVAAQARIERADQAFRTADGAWFDALYLACGDAALERQYDADQAAHPAGVRALAEARTLAFAEQAAAMAACMTMPGEYLGWAWRRFLAGKRP